MAESKKKLSAEERAAVGRPDPFDGFVLVDFESGVPHVSGLFPEKKDAEQHRERLLSKRDQGGIFSADKLFVAKISKAGLDKDAPVAVSRSGVEGQSQSAAIKDQDKAVKAQVKADREARES